MGLRQFASGAGALVVMAVLAGCGGAPTTPGSSSPAVPTVSCVYTPAGSAAKPVSLPPGTAPATGTLTVTLRMDAGDVTMTLDRAGAPCAVHSFESLAAQHYFDDTSCHRLEPGFVLQCGDPTGTSRGGPGYRYADELSGKETYTYGVVAMANAGPDTNGSQFFIVLGKDVGLPPQYDVLGSVSTAGMTVVESIVAQGLAQGGAHIATVAVS